MITQADIDAAKLEVSKAIDATGVSLSDYRANVSAASQAYRNLCDSKRVQDGHWK